MNKLLFHEKQYFRQSYIWLLVFLTDGIVLYSLIYILRIDNSPENSGTIPAIAGSLLLCLLMTVMFWKTALETTVTEENISFRFTLFQRKTKLLSPAEVKAWEIRNISPLRDFGGYGVKKSRKGTAYLVSGKKAAIFTLKDGKIIVIGTQKPLMLQSSLSRVFHSSPEQD